MRFTLQRWPQTLRVGRPAELMDRLLQALGVNPAAAARKDGGKASAEARATCLYCRNCRACEDWLDAGDGLPLPEDFCPNASFFRELTSSAGVAGAIDKAQCGRP
jgi:hypothetical protein